MLPTQDVDHAALIRELRGHSTWRFLSLGAVTYGLYWAFYIRKCSAILDRHLPIDRKLPETLVQLVVLSNVASVVLLVAYFIVESGEAVETASDLANVVASLSFVAWGFVARDRMNALLQAVRGEAGWFHALWTLLLSPVYFNYKVNQLADSARLLRRGSLGSEIS